MAKHVIGTKQLQKNRKGFMAIIPIVIAFFILFMGIWFLGSENEVTKRVSEGEHVKNMHALYLLRLGEEYEKCRKSDPDPDSCINSKLAELQ